MNIGINIGPNIEAQKSSNSLILFRKGLSQVNANNMNDKVSINNDCDIAAPKTKL